MKQNREIKNRWTGAIIHSGETNSIRELAQTNKANLSDADLRATNLSDANLSGANLSDADLSGANLRATNLSGANLSDADLSGANLSDASLSGAKQRVIRIHGSRHAITAINGDVRCGCIRLPILEMLIKYEQLGRNNGYSEDQLVEYGLHFAHIAALVKLPWLGEVVE